ncbi:MAG: hypothetical protein H0W99_05430 [Acidobacteria bacterium]|nr:hypothetical protein [Acidobacteriota bacterium]
MALANELSSDVAAAVLARKEDRAQDETKELLEVIRNFYSALRPLTVAARRRRIRAHSSNETQTPARRAVSGSN